MHDIHVDLPVPLTSLLDYHELAGASNPIHIDYDYAASRGFRSPLAHGNLMIILAVGRFFRERFKDAVPEFAVEAKFVRPVFAEDTVSITYRSEPPAADRPYVHEQWQFELGTSGQVAIAGRIFILTDRE